MRNKLLWLPLATVVVLLAASCKNGTKSDLMIPKDAAIVVHVNSASLSSKLSWKEIQQTEWFKEMNREANDSVAKEILKNPEASGIDAAQDIVYFMKKQGKGGYMVLEGSVKDADKFAKFNQALAKDAVASKDGNLNQMAMEENAVLSWNGSKFVYIYDAPFLNFSSMYNYGEENKNAFPADSLKKFAKEIFNLKSDNSLASDDRFTDLLKETGDVHLWMNSGNLYKGMVGGALSMMKVSALLDGNISASTLNFDNGKISFTSTQYYGKELASVLDKYEFKPVSATLINRIPTQDVVGTFVMNCPPELLKEIMVLAGVDGMANGALGSMNYSLDELAQASKGEVLFAVSDLQMKNKVMYPNTSYSYTSNEPDMKFLFAASVNNQPAFEKLVGIVKEQPHDTTQNASIDYKIQNNWFAVSNAEGYTAKFLAGGNNKQAFTDKIQGHPFGGYIDIQKIMKSTQSADTTTYGKGIMEASMVLWQDVVMYGGEYKKGKMTYHAEINFLDKKTNSLQQLNNYGIRLYALKKEKQRAMYDETDEATTYDTDSDTTVVVQEAIDN